MNRFIDERKNNWQRLEDLLSVLETSSIRGLPRAEVREFGELYRRAAADLAIARAETRDPKLVNYLNSLVIRAHGKIYRAENQGIGLIWKFFAREFPQTFRKNFRYVAIAFGIFVVCAGLGFAFTWQNLDFSQLVSADVSHHVRANNQWWLALNDANQIGASRIMTNNVLVTFRVFALGAFFGVGAFYDLAFEGLRMGSVFAVCYKIDPQFGNALAAFVVGHGVIEFSCIFFCAGAGMMIGYAMINPGDLTRGQALKKKGIEAARIVIGSSCFLIVAGTIEGFLSPSDLPAAVKVGTGILTGIAIYSYLFLVGRETQSEKV